MLFTTTSTLEGYEVEHYLGPVTAHVVIGTGFLADFFSAWTDFFGAKSRAYQNKLDEIERHTMTMLERKAQGLFANAILGLRVDFDEIAGAGKSMLMVTAMGTAVRVRGRRDVMSHPNSISASDLQNAILRQDYLDKAKAGKLYWNEEMWNYATQNAVIELAAPAVAHAVTRISEVAPYDKLGPQAWLERLGDFLGRLPQAVVEPIVYEALISSNHAHRLAVYLIRQLELLRPSRVLTGIASVELQHRVWFIQALSGDKSYWDEIDLHDLQAIQAVLPKAFSKAISIEEEKGMLGRTKKVWRCLCGEQVSGDDPTCASCTRDRYGFAQGQLKPASAAELIGTRIRALNGLMSSAEVAGVESGSAG
jgi:uncharacterized protein YbjQ (UPF0145 family)